MFQSIKVHQPQRAGILMKVSVVIDSSDGKKHLLKSEQRRNEKPSNILSELQ
jgi:hypothetical protein